LCAASLFTITNLIDSVSAYRVRRTHISFYRVRRTHLYTTSHPPYALFMHVG